MNKKEIFKKANSCGLASNLKNHKQRKSFIHNCPDECIEHICEVYYNVLKGGIKLSPKNSNLVKNKLTRHRVDVRKFIDPKVSVKEKRKLLTKPQFGNGIFSLLSSAILPVLIGLLSK